MGRSGSPFIVTSLVFCYIHIGIDPIWKLVSMFWVQLWKLILSSVMADRASHRLIAVPWAIIIFDRIPLIRIMRSPPISFLLVVKEWLSNNLTDRIAVIFKFSRWLTVLFVGRPRTTFILSHWFIQLFFNFIKRDLILRYSSLSPSHRSFDLIGRDFGIFYELLSDSLSGIILDVGFEPIEIFPRFLQFGQLDESILKFERFPEKISKFFSHLLIPFLISF